jgi:C-terminal processing protease CtpA/Prc
MTLRIAANRYLFPDGSEFEGIGIEPDIEVHTTIEDLKAGRDPVLERALQLTSKP